MRSITYLNLHFFVYWGNIGKFAFLKDLFSNAFARKLIHSMCIYSKHVEVFHHIGVFFIALILYI